MTIDEAIKHAREVASRKFDDRVHCIKCAEEHEQLAAWLEELKVLREKTQIQDEGLTDAYLLGKYDGIKQGKAEVVEEAEKELLKNGFIYTEHALDVWHKIAEQLRGGNE